MPKFSSERMTAYGEVNDIEIDYADVSIYSDREMNVPIGQKRFDLEFLKSCGIVHINDRLTLDFKRGANGESGYVFIRLKSMKSEETSISPNEEQLDKIREKFGSVL